MRYVRYSVKYGGNGLNGITELPLFRFDTQKDVLKYRLCNIDWSSGCLQGCQHRKIGANVFARHFVVCKRIFMIRSALESS